MWNAIRAIVSAVALFQYVDAFNMNVYSKFASTIVLDDLAECSTVARCKGQRHYGMDRICANFFRGNIRAHPLRSILKQRGGYYKPSPLSASESSASTNGVEVLILGGGCFWCIEAVFQQLDGVLKVASGKTGHAEVVRIEFDPTRVSTATLLDLFFASHDPTTKDRQGPDRGTCYRSVIFYDGDRQLEEAGLAVQRTQEKMSNEKLFGLIPTPRSVVTELVPMEAFYPAESVHQNFYERNPVMPYCVMHIAPKLASGKVRSIVAAANKQLEPTL